MTNIFDTEFSEFSENTFGKNSIDPISFAPNFKPIHEMCETIKSCLDFKRTLFDRIFLMTLFMVPQLVPRKVSQGSLE